MAASHPFPFSYNDNLLYLGIDITMTQYNNVINFLESNCTPNGFLLSFFLSPTPFFFFSFFNYFFRTDVCQIHVGCLGMH